MLLARLRLLPLILGAAGDFEPYSLAAGCQEAKPRGYGLSPLPWRIGSSLVA